MTIKWHPLARKDLIQLVTYIAAENPRAAYRMHDEIRRQIGILAKHPEAGRLAASQALGVGDCGDAIHRRLSRHPVTVTILRVLHGARRWPRAL